MISYSDFLECSKILVLTGPEHELDVERTD